MSKKKLKTDGIYFTGKAADEVTGSQYYVRFGKYQCLLECGLHQSSSNSYLDSYKINSEKFRFKPSEIDFVFVAHPHIDHCGLLPRLVKEGFHGQIIATGRTASIIKPLLFNSCYILTDEARVLSKRYGRDYSPLYAEKDVYETLSLVHEYDEYGKLYRLNDEISFQWLKNSHCIGAAQLQLIFEDGLKTRKILYTSDLGSLHSQNHFLSETEIPDMFNDVVIMESTYGESWRERKKSRSFDVEHLRVTVDTTLERGGSAILPCFSFSRTQEILSTLYDLYGSDETFQTDIVVDSKLSCDICKLYSQVLSGEDLQYWETVYNWERVKFISDKDESKISLMDSSPRIIISASGFCTNGRVVNYLKKYLKDRNSTIIFTGFVGDNPSYLSYRIKNRDRKYISINKESIPNLADCVMLSTFSSHASHSDLVTYGSALKTNKLILVHGSSSSKACLQKDLQDAISKNDNTYRVISAFRGFIVHL